MRRRTFLQALGAAGALTGLPAVALRRAFAIPAPGEAPKRLIVLSHCHGWPYDSWKIRPAGLDASAPWAVPLGEMPQSEWSQPLAPLYRHRARMIALDGLSLATAELDMDGNRHDTGWVQAWTGSWADFSTSDTRSTAASLDQLVAQQIARADRLPSLEVSVDDQLENGRPIAYGANGSRLPVENLPERVWQRLFGPSLSPAALSSQQKSVLDFAYGEYQQLAPRLDAAQQGKLDAHFALLSSLRQRLDGMATLNCESVPEPVETLASYDERFDAMAQLVGAALACDVTRVVTLSLGEMPTADFGADHITDDVHKGLAHEIYNNAEKHQAMTDYLTLHGEQVARLVDVLEALPDVDGRSVMDNTLIVWGSELANGWHGYQHYCPIILGGSWHFDTGRYLYRPHETPISMLVPQSVDPSGYSQTSGLPHQHLLVSAAQAMGLEMDHLGLKHVQGQNGDWVDLKGPIEGLA